MCVTFVNFPSICYESLHLWDSGKAVLKLDREFLYVSSNVSAGGLTFATAMNSSVAESTLLEDEELIFKSCGLASKSSAGCRRWQSLL